MSTKQKIKVGFEGHIEEIEVTVPEGEPQPWDADSQLHIVGKAQPRLDALSKVTGRARFTSDIKLPGMLHGRILRCPLPSARITSIELDGARALDGVKAVWGDKVGKRIFYAGQEVAAVAATSPEVAAAALLAIKVGYEPLPFVVDATEAKKPDAPSVFSSKDHSLTPEPETNEVPGSRVKRQGNVRLVTTSQPRGADIDQALAQCDAVLLHVFDTQAQSHASLERAGAVAQWIGDRLTVWCATQSAFAVRDQLAQALHVSKDRIEVVCENLGGGFGARFNAAPLAVLCATLAREAAAPVALHLSRYEEQSMGGERPDSVQWMKIGAKKDGALHAIYLDGYGTAGAGSGAAMGNAVRSLYAFPHWRTEEADVFTNTPPSQSARALGDPQGCFALEQSVDAIAEKLGIDPVELRKKNLSNPIQIAELDRIAKGPIEVVTDKGLTKRAALWPSRQKTGAGTGRKRRGIGIACGLGDKVVSRGTQVEIDVHSDGRIEVKSGAQDLGGGIKTALAMVAAEELSLPLSSIWVSMGDTNWPHGPVAGANATATSLAPAVRAAAFLAKHKILEVAGRILKATPAEMVMEDGLIRVKKDLGGGISFGATAARIAGEKITVVASRADDYEGRYARLGGVQVAEVEVDIETGIVRVLKINAIHDCGRVLNPLTAVSQVQNGIIQGISFALMEKRSVDVATGGVVNPDLQSYKLLGINDCPEIDISLFESSPGFNSTGTLGLGDPPIVPTAAAIANAVYNAIGVRVLSLPMTPDHVLAALAGRNKEASS